jgi:hypothetical protein
MRKSHAATLYRLGSNIDWSKLCESSQEETVYDRSVSMIPVLVLGFGFGILALFFRNAWRRYNPKGFAYFCLALAAMGTMGFVGSLATTPSSAPRVTVTGKCQGFQRIAGKGHAHYEFAVVVPGGATVPLQTPIAPPPRNRVQTSIPDGATVEVTYLDEKPAGSLPRAIGINILSGEFSGWHRSIDANWLGAWLAFPIGVALFAYCMFRALVNRRQPFFVRANQPPATADLPLK